MDGNVHDRTLVSSGGVIKSLHGTMLRVKCNVGEARSTKVTDGRRRCLRDICSALGHSQLWAGPDVDSEDLKRYSPTSTFGNRLRRDHSLCLCMIFHH